MSTLRSALDELRLDDLRFLSDEALAGDLDEIEHAVRMLEAQRARRLAEFERRGAFGIDGAVSMVAWLADRHGLGRGVAAAQVRLARGLEQMPLTADALAQGEVSASAVGLLDSAREASPDEFTRAEELLVEAARTLSVPELRQAVAYWKQAADLQAAELAEERRFERRYLHVSPVLDGMVRVDGQLDPDTGQTLITALRAVADSDVRTAPDLRSPGQHRADALGEICRRWLDSVDRPVVAGERPHVVVNIDLESLSGRLGRTCELQDVGRVTPEVARRWACDANVSRVITDARSEPMDVGRRTKVVPPPLRRAVAVRDHGCAFPSCDRPPGWCDAHPGLRRSLQHLPEDERSARGRVMEGESRGTSPCAGEGGQLGEDEGPASRDDPAGGVGSDAARHRQGVARITPVGELGALPDGRRLPRRGLAHLGCTSVA